MIEHAICRGCGKKLIGDPYYRNKALLAYTEDGKQCKINFYGGFVCDEICDKRATREMDDSIDAHNDPSGFYGRKAELNNPWD